MEGERKASDSVTFSQEFENEFHGEVDSEFPNSLLQTCVDPEMQYEVNARGDRAGFDVGRRRDLSSIVIVRKSLKTKDSTYHVIEKHTWAGIPFEEQQNRALAIVGRVGELVIDQGGMGEAPAEWLRARASNVRGVLFTNEYKTAMFQNLKRLFEQRRIAIPFDARLMASLNSIRRYYKLGRVVIDAERTDETGHADEATALAMA